ncbi:TNFAIP3-interacting protein 2 isoform X1 [Ictalurus furcatus]|uniref:TNFAIP3-interacting protein 2 isoform X1 n=1 Tax=Ictalurus furcatus TaxID=66913 RepID=UPI0023506A27|nr:TNFAIP3-interacting protein 2 isoform X1 [Ictalurus furcatus]
MDDDVTKLRSYATLNTFYHETQQEIANLGTQILTRDGIIAELKARLVKYERTCVRVEGEEPCVVGPSKSLVETLCRENIKLNQKLKEAEVDSAQKLESCKREIQSLQQKLREKEQMLEWPEHEKEREIQHLRASLAARDREQATRDVLCNSLADEAEQLRGQLGATVRVCEELLGKLEKQKKLPAIAERNTQVNEVTQCSELARLNGIIDKLQDENQQLKNRVAYVENLNSKWQKYDLSREEYVRSLCQKLKESSGGTSAGTVTLYQQEINRLNGLLEEKMLECDRLSRERDDRVQRNNERIQMLEQQVLAYVEDFKSERADRERAQSKILDLQDEVGRLQLQIRAQNSREATPTRRILPSLKKVSRKQTETVEPLLRNSPPDSSARRPNAQLAASGASELQCPRCLTMYDEKHTDEYLNHWEECARL